MIRSLDDLPDDAVIEADVAIVGAGAAGIAMALALAEANLRVLLLEAGGLEVDGPTQDLYEGEIVGLPYEPLQSSRLRYLGGTTNHWTGWCKPLDAVDLEARPELGADGWPFGIETIRPFYDRAQRLCEAGPYVYDDRLWPPADLDPIDGERLDRCYWVRSPPTRFGERYRADLAGSLKADLVLNANVVDIETNDAADHVTGLRLRSLQGRRARVVARSYVLAAGGIENARLLLASNRTQPEGLGNGRDVVGRYFMDHPHWELATVHTDAPYDLVDRYYRRLIGGRMHRVGWSLPAAVQRAAGCRNASAELELDIDDNTSDALAGIMTDLGAGRFPQELPGRSLKLLYELDDLAAAAWRKWVEGRFVNKPISRIQLMVLIDPQPNRDSRVTLAQQRDALGMPRVRLDWRLSDVDALGAALLTKAVATELTRLNLGRVQLHPALADPEGAWIHAGNLIGYQHDPALPDMSISWHNIGTTRMSSDPTRGVVDADAGVHGIDNLFVAGSSLFPSSGNANPTLTIVALALRLADHLSSGAGGPTAAVPRDRA